MLAFAVILSEPPIALFTVFLAYTLSGPVLAVGRQVRRKRKAAEVSESD
jgi:hypothetical protein